MDGRGSSAISQDVAPAALLAAYDGALAAHGLAPCAKLRTALAGAAERDVPLSSLQLRSAGLGAAGARALAKVVARDAALPRVNPLYLNLEDNGLGDEGATLLARALLQHPAVFRLDLGYNEITGRGLRAIGELVAGSAALLCLDLSGNNLWSRLSMLAPSSMSALAPLGRALGSPGCKLQVRASHVYV